MAITIRDGSARVIIQNGAQGPQGVQGPQGDPGGASNIASQAETDAGTNDTNAVSPLKLTNWSKISPNVQLGVGASAPGTEGTAVGPRALAEDTGDVSIGQDSSTTGSGARKTAVGAGATATANLGSAFGRLANAAEEAVAAGYDSDAAIDGTAIGSRTIAGTAAFAGGRGADASGTESVAIGGDTGSNSANAAGNFSVAVGTNTSTPNQSSVAIGPNAETSADGAFAAGRNITAALEDTLSCNNLEVQGSITNTVQDMAEVVSTTQSGTTYTLATADAFSQILLTNASQVTVTIPTNASVAIPIGSRIQLFAAGAGGVTLSVTGITLNGSSPNLTIAQNEALWLEKTATNTWTVVGGTSA